MVPILALETSTFAPLAHHGSDVLSENCCQVLIGFDAKVNGICSLFRREKILQVNGGPGRNLLKTHKKGYFSSLGTCVLHSLDTPALLADHRCPGSGLHLHTGCGYVNHRVDELRYSHTCVCCFKRHGRALLGSKDSHYLPEKKPLSKKKPPPRSSSPTSDQGPSQNTCGTKPVGASNNVTPALSPVLETDLDPNLGRRARLSIQLKLQRQQDFNAIIDDHNPTRMYPKHHPSDPLLDDMEWWLDEQNEEKPGVTPATQHTATKPVRSHIYSVEEMEAFAKERTRPENLKERDSRQ
jgi:hypothetical protein